MSGFWKGINEREMQSSEACPEGFPTFRKPIPDSQIKVIGLQNVNNSYTARPAIAAICGIDQMKNCIMSPDTQHLLVVANKKAMY